VSSLPTLIRIGKKIVKAPLDSRLDPSSCSSRSERSGKTRSTTNEMLKKRKLSQLYLVGQELSRRIAAKSEAERRTSRSDDSCNRDQQKRKGREADGDLTNPLTSSHYHGAALACAHQSIRLEEDAQNTGIKEEGREVGFGGGLGGLAACQEGDVQLKGRQNSA